MSQPLLSIGMIVKNEERCLEKCLKALEPLRQTIPCELVIADTGSTDRTKEIAEKYADILFDFEWINDFAAARNAVMDICRGKWFLSVDADEYLNSSVSELVNFLKSHLSDKMNLSSIVIRNHQKNNMNGIFTDFNALRMVRMASGRRYSGAIHEHFDINATDECYALTNTIFDHDGYTQITPAHLEEKYKRNLTLLETELFKEPKNIKIILQCLESASKQPSKRRYYTDYAIQILKEKNISDPNWETCAPACAYQATNYADYDNAPNLMDWYNWVFENFSKSDKIQIDVKYMYALRLYTQEKYTDAIKAGKEYLQALSTYETTKSKTNIFTFMNPVTYVHIIHENTIKVIIAKSMLQIDRFDEAKKILEKIDLTQADNLVISTWIESVLLMKKASAKAISKEILSNFLKMYNKNPLDNQELYEYLIAVLTNKFSNSNTNIGEYSVFSEVPGAIGISAKICDTKTKLEAEKLLKQIENFEEFMPLALKQALLLKCDLPKEFYITSSQRLSLLINDVTNVIEEIADVVINHYCKEENLKTFPQISFVFNLLLTALFSNNFTLNNELKLVLINNFVCVAERYMTECYNENLLRSSEYINCIPNLHLFSWYLVNAFKEKNENPLSYIKTLKEIIKKVPQAKQIIEFLIEEFKNEEETKRQEQIKNASPELVAMAEQLKTMLKAFPENSPELLAIKQSPMYKQVAFLIED